MAGTPSPFEGVDDAELTSITTAGEGCGPSLGPTAREAYAKIAGYATISARLDSDGGHVLIGTEIPSRPSSRLSSRLSSRPPQPRSRPRHPPPRHKLTRAHVPSRRRRSAHRPAPRCRVGTPHHLRAHPMTRWQPRRRCRQPAAHPHLKAPKASTCAAPPMFAHGGHSSP